MEGIGGARKVAGILEHDGKIVKRLYTSTKSKSSIHLTVSSTEPVSVTADKHTSISNSCGNLLLSLCKNLILPLVNRNYTGLPIDGLNA